MKKVLCLVALLLATGPATFAASNLLQNAGFETQGSDWTKAYHWEWDNPDQNGAMFGSAIREGWRYLSGSWEGVVRGTWAGAYTEGGMWQQVPATAGKTYRFTGLFWQDDWGNKFTSAVQVLKMEFFSGTTNMLSAVTNEIAGISQNWVGRSVQAVAPTNTVWARGVIYVIGMGPNGALQFDDLSLIEVPTNNIRVGPSSRRTGLVISEIMYHPTERVDGKDLEFVEIFNTVPVSEKLDGYELKGDIDYEFPANTTISGFSYLVVAKDPSAMQSVYGITGVMGSYTGSLSNGGGTVKLQDELGGEILIVEYDDESPWTAAADGAGHSLTLSAPSYGENDPRAWSQSFYTGGSPGNGDVVVYSPRNEVMINEVQAHTDPPDYDYIELYNASTQSVSLQGCWLSDSPSTNKYRFPATNIAARSFVLVTTNQLGFNLSSAGETVYFRNSNDTRVIDSVRFGGTENGVTLGRYPDGAVEVRELRPAATPGTANRSPLIRDIVINEIMYHPISENDDDEYIELHNRGTSNVNVGAWQFVDGITFTIPAGTVIPASNYLVVARNRERLLSIYTNLNAGNCVGDYSGSLANSGERVALAYPHDSEVLIVVDEVSYDDGGRWGLWSDAGGSSLELKDPHADNRWAANWGDSDETAKGAWTNVTFTGVLDHGMNVWYVSIDELHLLMLRKGECLVDNVVVSNSTGSGNLIANSTFESGGSGWTAEGNLIRSSLETNGYSSTRSLHVRASGGGDTGANKIKTSLTSTPSAGNTCTISAQARWLRGNAYLLMRLRGNYLEAVGKLPVPANLGTPGARNSRYTANVGPAISGVSHTPLMPLAGQAVAVRARVDDPDGVSSVQLKYRLDPSATVNTLTMSNLGAGVYGVSITGQPLGKLVAFYVQATDSNSASILFPENPTNRECLIRWGEIQNGSDFGTYRFWLSKTNLDTWTARAPLADEELDMTLVYPDENRVIYNTGIRYRGSPFIRTWYSEPGTGINSYVISPPKDDLLLGADELNLDTLEPWEGRDETRVRERTSFWIAREMGLGYCYQRFVHVFLNGTQHGDVYGDVHHVDSDYIKTWFPDDPDGQLYKLDDWFEFGSTFADLVQADADLQLYVTTGGEKKKARYRWSWERKANGVFDDNYSNLFALVDAANLSNAWYTSALESIADVEEWMRLSALRHVVVDWDAYAFRRGKNMFAYRPEEGKWKLLLWDMDMGLGASGESSNNCPVMEVDSSRMPVIARMTGHAPFQRMFWQALYDAVNGPVQSSQYEPFMDEWHEKMQQSGVGAKDPATVQSWLSGRRTFILSSMAAVTNAPLAIRNNGGSDFSIASNMVALIGTAPIQAKEIRINGVSCEVTWTTVTNWMAYVVLSAGTNNLSVQSYDSDGNLLSGLSDTIKVNYTGSNAAPQGSLVINEVMYNPASDTASEYVEIVNLSSNTFDLHNYQLDGVDMIFDESAVIQPGEHFVVVEDTPVFAATYGTAIRIGAKYDGAMDNGGEWLKLFDASGALVDEVFFDDDAPWPTNADGYGASLQLMDRLEDNNRVGNWTAATNGSLCTPGAVNSVTSDLPPFASLWLNELQPTNITGLRDNFSERDPWIELYNSDSAALNLTNYYLTDSYTNLAKWAFRTNAVVPTNAFLVVWADTQTHQTVYMTNHASFRLSTATGSVALVYSNAGRFIIVDYVNFMNIPADRSYGSYPDGVWSNRVVFGRVSPGATNNSVGLVLVYVNEWMADNDAIYADPADGNYEDWFELYNASTTSVDLSGYTLTDTLGTPAKWVISNGVTIAGGGFLVVWADSEPAQNLIGGVHANFALSKSGEALGLFTPEGVPVDTVTFAAQTLNVSEGRWWDGRPSIYTMAIPTPGSQNIVSVQNTAPVLTSIGTRMSNEMTLFTFAVSATDTDAPPQRLLFSLGAGAPAGASINPTNGVFTWTPEETDGPGTNSVTIRVTDNGWTNKVDEETVSLVVAEVNRAPTVGAVDGIFLEPGSLLILSFSATDPDVPANDFSFSLDAGYPAGAEVGVDGLFRWEPTDAQALTTNAITVRATDSGSPALADTEEFVIEVGSLAELFSADVDAPVGGSGDFTISWLATSGRTYRVHFCSNLMNGAWSTLAGDITATSSVALKADSSATGETQRIYRVIRLLP